MSGLHDALAELLERELADRAEADARSARAGVRCTDCGLRYDLRQDYGCHEEGRGHAYDEDELDEAAERARREPREYVTLSVAEVRALLAETPPADLPATQVVGTTEPVDWIADPGTPAAEKLARFQALGPTPTLAPADPSVDPRPGCGSAAHYPVSADLPVATGDAGTEVRATAIERAAEAMVWHRWPGERINPGDRAQAERAVDAVLAVYAAGSGPEDAGERVGLSEDERQVVSDALYGAGRRPAADAGGPVFEAVERILAGRLAAVEQERDRLAEAYATAPSCEAQATCRALSVAAALLEQVAAAAALLAEAEKLTSERPNYDFDGNRFEIPIPQARLRAALADPDAVLARQYRVVTAPGQEVGAGPWDTVEETRDTVLGWAKEGIATHVESRWVGPWARHTEPDQTGGAR